MVWREDVSVLELGWKRHDQASGKVLSRRTPDFGVSAPPGDQNERTFVVIWLGIAAFLVAFGVALTYSLPYLYFKR